MRDGTILRADLLRPGGEGRHAVLLYRTCYGRKDAQKEYTTFQHAVARGYAILIQDVRGRYDSGGEFRPYENEGRDGYDTIEWAAKQAWSDGNIGTFGLSYPGAVQWLAAVENPPHLKAMVPAMTFSTPQNFFYSGGAWDLSWIEWIWDNIAPDIRGKRNLPGPKTETEAIAAWQREGRKLLSATPLNNLPQFREFAPYYLDWLSHPPEDPWWNWAELRGRYANVHAAVLNLSGWYDDNYGPEGATTNFAGLLNSRTSDSEARTHLLLGPWVHGVDATGKNKAGERTFSAIAAIDYDEVVLRWMDHYLRGIDNGVELEPAVRYYVMGSEEWRESARWPPTATRVPYFLTLEDAAARGKTVPNNETVNSRKGSASGASIGLERPAGGTLTLEAPRSMGRKSTFLSDPENPVENSFTTSGGHDYRALRERSDVLTFDSAALQQDTEVTGPIHGEIYMSCDCRDADVWVRLLDVAPDGSAYNLMSPGLDVVRASYREPRGGRQLLQPGKIYAIHLDNLITSNVFKKSHRIRVQISASFFPNFSRNPQTGDSERTSGKFEKANITIYSDREHASQIVLPIVGSKNPVN